MIDLADLVSGKSGGALMPPPTAPPKPDPQKPSVGSMIIRADGSKFKWISQTTEKQNLRIQVQMGFAAVALAKMDRRFLKYVRLRDIPFDLPNGEFQRTLLHGAERWVRYMEKKTRDKWHLTIPETNMLVYGPVPHVVFQGWTNIGDIRAVGENLDAPYEQEWVDFKVWGVFIPEYGHAFELGPERPEWTIKVDGPTPPPWKKRG